MTKKRIDKRNRWAIAKQAGRRVISFEVPEEFHALVGRLATALGCSRAEALIRAGEALAESILPKNGKK